jgi:hypothetical protein
MRKEHHMPVTRFGGSEEEKVAKSDTQTELLKALNTNRAIGDAIVKEIGTRFGRSDLSGKLANPNAIHVSFSWG